MAFLMTCEQFGAVGPNDSSARDLAGLISRVKSPAHRGRKEVRSVLVRFALWALPSSTQQIPPRYRRQMPPRGLDRENASSLDMPSDRLDNV